MNKIIPKIRFKEFNNEYNNCKLKDIVDFYRGNTLSKADLKENGIKKCILYGELYTKYSEIAYEIFSRTNNSNKNLFLGKTNDVLIPCSGETALDISTSTCLQEDNVVIGGDLNVLRPKKDDGKYLSYLLCHKKRREIAKFAQGDSIVHLYGEKIKNINIHLPNMKEQIKVSDLLSLLDKKIELQQEKIENLKLYKKGLITNLLNKNQNTYFKNCFLHIGGTALEKYIITNSKYRFISIGNYSSDGTYIDNQQFIEFNEKTKEKLLNKDDLVMVLNDKTSQGKIIGSTILVEQNDLYIYNQRSERIICKENVLPKYAWILLNSTSVRNYIFEKSQGGTQIYINFNEIEKMKLYVPDLIEQENIINTIFPLLKKIELQENKLKQLNDLRTSLLQQMFI